MDRNTAVLAGGGLLAVLLAAILLLASSSDEATGTASPSATPGGPGRESGEAGPPRRGIANGAPVADGRREPGPTATARGGGSSGSSIVVRVVDESGAPAAGVPLQLWADGVEGSGRPVLVSRGTSSATGRAHMECDEWAAAPLRVRAAILSASPVESPVESFVGDAPNADELAPRVVDLALPPTGRVLIDLVHDSGARVDEVASVGLRARPVGAGSRPGDAGAWTAGELRAQADTGSFAFEWVGLGLELRADARLERAGVGGGSLDLLGPGRASERVAGTLRLGPEDPWVRMRVVDGGGGVLNGERLVASFVWAPTGESAARVSKPLTVPVQRGEAGELRVRVPGRTHFGLTRTLTVIETAPEGAGSELRSAPIDLSAELDRHADTDLGEVVLRRQERSLVTWVAGRLRDEGGTAVGDARVLVVARPSGERASAQVEASGAFSVQGPAVGEVLRVTVVHPDYLRIVHDDVAFGAHGLDLTLERSARLSGRILLDDDVAPGALVATVLARDGAHRTDIGSGLLRAKGLVAGEASLEIRTRAGDWLVARVDGLRASADDGPPDPRVDPLDLRGRIATLRLRLRDPQGQPLGRVFTRVAVAGQDQVAGVWVEDGWLTLVVPARSGPLLVSPSGFRQLEVEPLTRLQDLHCTPL